MKTINYFEDDFRLVVVDDDDTTLNSTKNSISDSCSVELRIKKSFLKKILFNLNGQALDIDMTDREIEVLKYLANGLNNNQIAEKMNISVHTVKVYIHSIFDKLCVQDRTKAVVTAFKGRIIDL